MEPSGTCLTLSRRVAFSASHRVERAGLTADANRELYGDEAAGAFGHGHNYVAYFVLTGDVDEATGMLVSLRRVKALLSELVDGRYDHRFLNLDTPPFGEVPATVENIALRLLLEAEPLFGGSGARLVACHLAQSPGVAATAYGDGTVESHRWLVFSAARRTASPHLDEEANRRLFGIAADPGGHGHTYRCRVTLGGAFDPDAGVLAPERRVSAALAALHELLDHRNLSTGVPELAGLPTTTEVLARFVRDRLAAALPVERVRLHETDDFFAEALPGGRAAMGAARSFSAAHRLHSRHLDAEANRRLYGRCNNPNGHGHEYRVEATADGTLDERSGTLLPLDVLAGAVEEAVGPWRWRHLDLEVPEFADRPSTGENIVRALWPRAWTTLGERLSRLRLWETENNRFTVRAGGMP